MSDRGNTILPTRWVAEVLQHRSLLISNRIQKEPIPIDSAIRMVFVALTEILEQRQMWRKPGVFRYTDIIDAAGVPWALDRNTWLCVPELTGDNDQYSICDLFSCFLLNNLINEIETNLLNPFYPSRSFDLLSIEPLENGDAVLQNLGDYRIWRLDQLVREGKATY